MPNEPAVKKPGAMAPGFFTVAVRELRLDRYAG
jgi:hypothetical protein